MIREHNTIRYKSGYVYVASVIIYVYNLLFLLSVPPPKKMAPAPGPATLLHKMVSRFITLCSIILPVLFPNVVVSGLTVSEQAGEQRITTKILKLLEKMSEDLSQDQDNDDRQNEKFECWCKVNALEKTDAVKALEAEIENLGVKKAEALARVERLKVGMLGRELYGLLDRRRWGFTISNRYWRLIIHAYIMRITTIIIYSLNNICSLINLRYRFQRETKKDS